VAITGTEWAVIISAAVASSLTTCGSLVVESLRAKHQQKTARLVELTNNCKEVISAAHKLMIKSQALHVSIRIRSGARENLEVFLHQRKSIDILELNDYLMVEQGKILDSRAALWILGDEMLVKGADEVLSAVQELITASTELPPEYNDLTTNDITKVFKRAARNMKPVREDLGIELKIRRAGYKLWRATVAFALLIREKLKVDDVDALIRAFPTFSNPPAEYKDDEPDEEPGTRVADWQL
jgi:hypothetical protein